MSGQAFYSSDELAKLGFVSVGINVRIHKTVQLYVKNSSISDDCRLDGPSVLTGTFDIGRNVHIGPFCRLASGVSKIIIGNDVGISSHCSVYATSEDFSNPSAYGNPTHDKSIQNTITADLSIGNQSMLGTGVTLLPGASIGSAVAISADVTVRRRIESNVLVVPREYEIRLIKRRK